MISRGQYREKAKVTEVYEVDQVISVNPRRTQGKQHTGQIEITVPYDGLRYFTRRAARDVERARGGSQPPRTRMPPSAICCSPSIDHVESLPTGGADDHRGSWVIPIAVSLPGNCGT